MSPWIPVKWRARVEERETTCLVRDRAMSMVVEQKPWCYSVFMYHRDSNYYYKIKTDFTRMGLTIMICTH